MGRGPVRRAGRPGLIGAAARTAVVAGTATAVSGRVSARQQRREAEQQAYQQQAYEQQMFDQQPVVQQPQAPAQPAPAPQAPTQPAAAGGGTITDQIERLAALHAQGAISAEEFTAAKQRLLGL
nr:SHOCT domain-containing protein [Phaeacidiphilus oryzae]